MWGVSDTEPPSKKKVKKNNPEMEADYLSDHSCFVSHVTTSSLHTNALVCFKIQIIYSCIN
jgi:hypothetical protein